MDTSVYPQIQQGEHVVSVAASSGFEDDNEQAPDTIRSEDMPSACRLIAHERASGEWVLSRADRVVDGGSDPSSQTGVES